MVSRKTLLWAAVLLVVGVAAGVGIWAWGQRQANQPSYKYQAAVTLSQAGFAPGTLSVKSGTRVTFSNTDATAHRLALTGGTVSPDPAFSGVEVPAGRSYSFIFTKVGTYHLHDGVHPEANAVVEVAQ